MDVLEWRRTFGGSFQDNLNSLTQTPDGGYILGGGTSPPLPGAPFSGNKTSPNFGSQDFWVVKVDAQGNKEWEHAIGGVEEDEISVVEITSEGGYLLGGYSDSPISGNKTSNNFGFFDYWIVKLAPVYLEDGGRVFYWEDSENVTLEAVDNLNMPWEDFSGPIAMIGGVGAVNIDPSNQQMFYRLRSTEPDPDPELKLSIGRILTWPANSGQILESSANQIDPWEAFQGVQGVDGDSNIAIIPQEQFQHYFRTRSAN